MLTEWRVGTNGNSVVTGYYIRSSIGLTVSQAKTDILCLQTKGGEKVSFTINAAGQVYKQTIEFVHLGGTITADKRPWH